MKIGGRILATTDDGKNIILEVRHQLADSNYMAADPWQAWVAIVDPVAKTISAKLCSRHLVKYVEILDTPIAQ